MVLDTIIRYFEMIKGLVLLLLVVPLLAQYNEYISAKMIKVSKATYEIDTGSQICPCGQDYTTYKVI